MVGVLLIYMLLHIPQIMEYVPVTIVQPHTYLQFKYSLSMTWVATLENIFSKISKECSQKNLPWYLARKMTNQVYDSSRQVTNLHFPSQTRLSATPKNSTVLSHESEESSSNLLGFNDNFATSIKTIIIL